MMHEKIRPHHLKRKAMLYIRQSSAHQVLHNGESSTLQYAMRDRHLDRRVQEAVPLVLDKVAELGSAPAGPDVVP